LIEIKFTEILLFKWYSGILIILLTTVFNEIFKENIVEIAATK